MSAIVFEDRLYGLALPSGVRDAALALAGLAETRLLGIELIEARDGEWWFSAASPVPDLRVGGDPLLDALAIALGGPTR